MSLPSIGLTTFGPLDSLITGAKEAAQIAGNISSFVTRTVCDVSSLATQTALKVSAVATRKFQEISSSSLPPETDRFHSFSAFTIPESEDSPNVTERVLSSILPPTSPENNQQIKETTARYAGLASVKILLHLASLSEKQSEEIERAFYLLFRDDTLDCEQDTPASRNLKQNEYHQSFEQLIKKNNPYRLDDHQRIELENLIWNYFMEHSRDHLSYFQQTKLWLVYRLSFFYMLDITECITHKIVGCSRFFTSGKQNQNFKNFVESLLEHFSAFFTKVINERTINQNEINANGGVGRHFEAFLEGHIKKSCNPGTVTNNNLYEIAKGSTTQPEIHRVFCQNLVNRLPQYSLAIQSQRTLQYFWNSVPHYNPDVRKIANVAFQAICSVSYYMLKVTDKIIGLILFHYIFKKIIIQLADHLFKQFGENADFQSSLDQAVIILCNKIKNILNAPVSIRENHIEIVDQSIIKHFIDQFLSFIEGGIFETPDSSLIKYSHGIFIPTFSTKDILSQQISEILGHFFSSFNSEKEVEKLLNTCLHGATRIFQRDGRILSIEEKESLKKTRIEKVDDLLNNLIHSATQKRITGERKEAIRNKYEIVIQFFMQPIHRQLSSLHATFRDYLNHFDRANPAKLAETQNHLIKQLNSLSNHITSMLETLKGLQDVSDAFKENIKNNLSSILPKIRLLQDFVNGKLSTQQHNLTYALESLIQWKAFSQILDLDHPHTFFDPGFWAHSPLDELKKHQHPSSREHSSPQFESFVLKLESFSKKYIKRISLKDLDINQFIQLQEEIRRQNQTSFFASLFRNMKQVANDLLGRSSNLRILQENLTENDYKILLNFINQLEEKKAQLQSYITEKKNSYLLEFENEIRNEITPLVNNKKEELQAYIQWLESTHIQQIKNQMRQQINSILDHFNQIVQFMNTFETPNISDTATKNMRIFRAGVIATAAISPAIPTIVAAAMCLPPVFNYTGRVVIEKGCEKNYHFWIQEYINRIIKLSGGKLFPTAMATNLMHFANERVFKA